MAVYTTIELARIAPTPGAGKRLELELEPGEVSLGGHTYALSPAPVEGRLEVSRTASGFALRLAFEGALTGPCMRCLADAGVPVAVEAREVDQAGTDDEELRSPYVAEGRLDLDAWAHDALVLGDPPATALPTRLRRAVRGLRRVPQRRRARRPRPSARARPPVGEAARAPVAAAQLPFRVAMAVPKKRTSSQRRDKRRATHTAAKPRLNECPRCHSPRLPHRVCPVCGTYAGREVITHEIAELEPPGAPE